MIIAAYPGTGKGYFAERIEDAVNFPVMPYKYTKTEKESASIEEGGRSKANQDRELNPDWPENYVRAVANQFHDHRYFMIPSDVEVMEALQKLQIPYILVYPEGDAREEYRRRLLEQGNAEVYVDALIRHWDSMIVRLRSDSYGWCIELPKEKYLLDIKDKIDEIIDNKETCVPIDVEPDVAERAEKAAEENGLSLAELSRRCMVWAVHHKDEVRKLMKDQEIGTS